MFLSYTVLFALAYGAGILLRMLFSPSEERVRLLTGDWLRDFAIVAGGALLLSLLDFRRWTVRIHAGDRLEGASGAFGERVTIPIDEIDWTQTGRSLQSRVKLGNGIYAISRERILISPWFYSPGDYQDFLERIGFSR